MPEILFYHLTSRTLEEVLPDLLQRSLDRGWRCAVQAGQERLKPLDDLLWTFAEDSFLPHGVEADDGADQPVVLLDHAGNPNRASVRFLLDGAALPEDAEDYERVVVLFDGRDEAAVALSRERWREVKAKSLPASYWQQDEAGRWRARG